MAEKKQIISKEVTPCPPYIPNERVPYDELRVWLEMHLRDHYRDIVSLWDNIEFGEFTPGSIIFADTDGGLTEDNANLFYDDTNNRVGIGTNTPAAFLHVLGTTAQLRLAYDATKYVNFTLDTNHDLTVTPTSTGQIIFQPTTDSTDFFQVLDADGGTPIVNVDSTNERLGVGLNNPRDILEVYQRFITDPTLYNTLIGETAGSEITTGTRDTHIGYHAGLYGNGSDNVTLGYLAGEGTTGNSYSTSVIIGSQAAIALTTASSNVLMGYQAGYSLTTAGDGVFIGYQAGFGVTDTAGNVYIGYQAGYQRDTPILAIENVCIGYQAGYNFAGETSDNTAVCVGYRAGYYGRSYRGTFVGAHAGEYTSSTTQCTYLGANAGKGASEATPNKGMYCTGVGYNALGVLTLGDYNTALGSNAGNKVTTASNITAIGYAAVNQNIIANHITGVGSTACYSATAGQNTGIGSAALYGNTTGTGNTACGTYAGTYAITPVNENCFFGYYAGYDCGNGSVVADYNLIFGAYAGRYLRQGSNNVIVGYKAGGFGAGSGNVNFSNSVYIGAFAGYNQTVNSNLFIIDNQDRGVLNHEPYECFLYGTFGATSGAQSLTLNADMLIRNDGTMGSESLNETDFTTHAKWDVTGDFNDAGGNATYTHATGAGTLTQTSANMAVAGVSNGWYCFTYDVSNSGGSGTTAIITTSFAANVVTLPKTLGSHTVYFQAAVVPGNFVISVTSTAADTFILDNFSLKELQGGTLNVNKIMRCKRLLAGGIAA